MNHAKPEISIPGTTSRIIQHTEKLTTAAVDSNPPLDSSVIYQFTANAYESDE